MLTQRPPPRIDALVLSANARGLAPVTALLGLHYLPLTGMHLLSGEPAGTVTGVANGVSAILLLALATLWWNRPPEGAAARHGPLAVALLALANVTIHYTLAGDPQYDSQFAIVLLGGSMFLLSPRAMGTFLAASVVCFVGSSALFVPEIPWARDLLYLGAFTAVAAGVHYARTELLLHVETLRTEAQYNALRASESFDALRQVIDRNPDLVLIHSQQRVLYANDAASAAFDVDRKGGLLDSTLESIVVDETGHALRWLSAEREGKSFDATFRRSNGEHILLRVSPPREVEWRGETAILLACRDVTSRNAELRSRSLMTERLAALGTLAAGVAHEINTPLSYVMLNAERASEKLEAVVALPAEQRTELNELLDSVLDGGRRIEAVVKDVGGLAHPSEQRRLGLDEVARAALRLAAKRLQHSGSLEQSLDATPEVYASEAALGQVAVNLLLNAADAIEGRPDGTIEVRTYQDASGSAVLEVRDTGPGMEAGTRLRAFEPFFTTKPVGQGSGLGLSVCHDVVRRLGGRIDIDTAPGEGCSMRIVLPAAPSAGQQRVLVIDDDLMLANTLERLLDDRDVTVLNDAREALPLIAEHPFDVMVVDVMMPHMTGVQFYEAVAAAHPEELSRIVFMTGGTFIPEVGAQLTSLANTVLRKPLRAQLLRSTLDAFGTRPAPGLVAPRSSESQRR